MIEKIENVEDEYDGFVEGVCSGVVFEEKVMKPLAELGVS